MSLTKRLKLTQRVVKGALEAQESGKRERNWFADFAGLCLQITPSGCASYCLRYEKPGGGKGDYTIDQTTKITVQMGTCCLAHPHELHQDQCGT